MHASLYIEREKERSHGELLFQFYGREGFELWRHVGTVSPYQASLAKRKLAKALWSSKACALEPCPACHVLVGSSIRGSVTVGR